MMHTIYFSYYLSMPRKDKSIKISRTRETVKINALIKKNGEAISCDGKIIRLVQSKRTGNYRILIEYEKNDKTKYLTKLYYKNQLFEEEHGASLFSKKLDLYGRDKVIKEICENFAAYYHVRSMCCPILGNPNVLCITVADGVAPRAGSIFSMHTKWQVHSVDPLMREKWTNKTNKKFFPNLTCHTNTIENSYEEIIKSISNPVTIVVIGVHSHANLNDLWIRITTDFNKTPILFLSIPCCKGFQHHINGVEPILNITDENIPTTANRILIWTKNWDDKIIKSQETTNKTFIRPETEHCSVKEINNDVENGNKISTEINNCSENEINNCSEKEISSAINDNIKNDTDDCSEILIVG